MSTVEAYETLKIQNDPVLKTRLTVENIEKQTNKQKTFIRSNGIPNSQCMSATQTQSKDGGAITSIIQDTKIGNYPDAEAEPSVSTDTPPESNTV